MIERVQKRTRGELSDSQIDSILRAKKIDAFRAEHENQVLINCSNHSNWDETQMSACNLLPGFELTNVQFPNVPPTAISDDIDSMAIKLSVTIENALESAKKIYIDKFFVEFPEMKGKLTPSFTPRIHIMGEMCLIIATVKQLSRSCFTCCASTTERISTEENGVKKSVFNFVQFRNYTTI